MHWAGLNEFLAMGGYGFYVWLSFGLTLACMVGELWLLGQRRRRLQQEEMR